MRHIDYTTKSRAERTSADWLPIGASIAELANDWANRTDLVAFIGEGATEGLAPALFKPEIAEIEINVDSAFGFGVTPAHIGDLRQRSARYEFPRATGAILHEAMHARYSRWSIPKAHEDLAKDELDALILLEESRIEYLGILLDPKNRAFLRATALEIVIGDLSDASADVVNVASAARLLGLVQARVIAGVLLESEVFEITDTLREVLGSDVFNQLSKIATEFQQHDNHYVIDAAYPLAKEWARIVRELQDERGESGEGEEGGESGEGESGEGTKSMKDLLDALRDAADYVSISNNDDLSDQQQSEDWAEEVESRKSDAREQQKHADTSADVFGRGTGEVAAGRTHSVLVEQRSPHGSERAAAVIVARMLEKAKYRERDVVEVTSQIPQGRLRSRAAVQNAAQRALGQMPTAEAWQRKVRKQTDEPTLNVGVMVDISGSMRSAMEPMATTAWVMSEAVRRVQGRAAMVYYGQDVFATLRAGQHLDGVNVWSANDPTERFDKAFKALDGSLNLLHGSGARLLVVVSDGVYTPDEQKAAAKWVQRCKRDGVAVLWLTFQEPRNSYASALCRGTDAIVLDGRLDPAAAALEIGKAAARALEITSMARVA